MSVDELLAADRFAARLGARLVTAEPDRVVVEMDIDDHHLDGEGRVAGGVLFSLADCALSLISNASGTAVALATHLVRNDDRARAAILRADIQPVTDMTHAAVTFRAVLTADGSPVVEFTGTTLKV